MRKLECVLVAILLSTAAFSQALLTNDVIVRMVKAGVSDDVIVTMVDDKLGQYSLTPNDLIALKQAGVSDKVVGAMVSKNPPSPTRSAPAIVFAANPVAPASQQAPRVQTPVAPPQSPDTLTNESVLKLVKAGLGEDVILSMINSQSGQYSLSTDSLIALKQAGASDKIMSAMVNRNVRRIAVEVSGPVGTPAVLIAPIVNPAPEQTSNSAQSARIFITDSNSWEMSGGFAAGSSRSGGGGSGGFAGGARPQTVEIIKTFGERCPGATITMNRGQAQFIVLLDHEGGKGYARKDNKIAVFKTSGDLLFSHSTRSLGNAVKDACEAISR